MSTPIKLFQPSNATVGEAFIADWCGRCKHDRVMNGTVILDEAGDDDFCQILGATMAFSPSSEESPREWRYDEDGEPVCTSFLPADAPEGPSCAVRDEVTVDMFGGAA